jgi:site-specific DNA-methyltransferase (cytosine-N4-specific)
MRGLLKNGYRAKLRPSGHDISEKFSVDNGAAIPPNLLAISNTESNSYYLRYCRENGLTPHPARFPAELPEYFIRMLTDPGDLVVDPFAGSCVTGEVAERTERRWLCVELREEYLRGALARFDPQERKPKQIDLFGNNGSVNVEPAYRIFRPGALWDSAERAALPQDGRRKRSKKEST